MQPAEKQEALFVSSPSGESVTEAVSLSGSTPSTRSETVSPRKLSFSALLYITGAITLFWLLRISYWDVTFESLFSDMADFEKVARGVLRNFDFRSNSFWITYKPPVLPAARALQLFLFGEGLQTWRYFSAIFLFASLCFLCYELSKLRYGSFLAGTLLLLVSLSKSSVFWSFKMSTESLGEALLYLSLAVCLNNFRRTSGLKLLLSGATIMVAVMHRPNSIGLLPLFLFFFLVARYSKDRTEKPLEFFTTPRVLRFCREAILFCLGALAIWSPWLLRSYNYYGAVVPFNTSGSLAFVYGFDKLTVPGTEPGTAQTYTYDGILASAEDRFSNDYELYAWSGSLVKTWMAENWVSLPAIVLDRILKDARDRDVQLTRVSRVSLFSNGFDSYLVDKEPLLLLTGALGLLLLPLIIGLPTAIIGLSVLSYWLVSALCMSNARLIEPILPLLIFGNVSWPLAAYAGVEESRLNPEKLLSSCKKWIFVVPFSLIGLFLITYAKPTSPIGPIALLNPSFESWPENEESPPGWQRGGGGKGELRQNLAAAVDGQASLQVKHSAGEIAIYQDIPPQYLKSLGAKDFVFSAFVKASSASQAYLAISDGERWLTSAGNSTSNQWEELRIQSITPDSPSMIRIHLFVRGGDVSLDKVSLDFGN